MRSALDTLVDDLSARITGAELSPQDQVRVLARLLTAVGYHQATPGLATDRRALEAAVARGDDLPATLILQGHILHEWVAETPASQRRQRAAA
jgi:hypothetical protein